MKNNTRKLTKLMIFELFFHIIKNLKRLNEGISIKFLLIRYNKWFDLQYLSSRHWCCSILFHVLCKINDNSETWLTGKKKEKEIIYFLLLLSVKSTSNSLWNTHSQIHRNDVNYSEQVTLPRTKHSKMLIQWRLILNKTAVYGKYIKRILSIYCKFW